MKRDPDDVDALAAEILRYLDRHPGAADTSAGIAEWWIRRQRIDETRERVQTALDRLVAQGRIGRREAGREAVFFLPAQRPGDGRG